MQKHWCCTELTIGTLQYAGIFIIIQISSTSIIKTIIMTVIVNVSMFIVEMMLNSIRITHLCRKGRENFPKPIVRGSHFAIFIKCYVTFAKSTIVTRYVIWWLTKIPNIMALCKVPAVVIVTLIKAIYFKPSKLLIWNPKISVATSDIFWNDGMPESHALCARRNLHHFVLFIGRLFLKRWACLGTKYEK